MSSAPVALTPQPVPRYALNTGASLPAVGLGSWMGAMGEATDRVEAMVATALKVGYRAFDTAAGYGNEEAVGRAIRTSGIPREDIFVTTKMRKKNHHFVREGFEASLQALGLDYVDLYLMHWPIASVDGVTVQPDEFPTIIDTWRAMEALIPTGKCKAIGVSNFSIPLLEKLLDPSNGCTVVPAVNQIECHPSRPQFELVEWCQKKGIHVTAYSSLGQPGGRPEKGALAIPDVFFAGNPLKPLADKYNVTVGQILLSWAVARGISVIPKTEKEERMRANASLIRLNDEDTTFLNDWHKQKGMHRSLCPYHSLDPVPGVFGWTYEQLGWDGMEAGGVIS